MTTAAVMPAAAGAALVCRPDTHFWAHLHYLAHTAPNPQQSGPRNLWDEIDTVHYW
jgi:hypothetical protein